MRKIKRFKLVLRHKEVLRRAKKAGLPLGSLGTDPDGDLQAFLSTLANALEPAVAFESFGARQPGAELAPLPGLGFSLGLATLGRGFEAAVEAVSDPDRQAVARVAVRVALDQAAAFAGGLISEEAAAEKCELSPFQPVLEAAALEALLARIDGFKIGVSLADGALTPSCSAAFSVSWIAKPRAKTRRA